MLNSIDLNDKSYEELLSEALAQIPLYSDEWTNFNISDPGITVLQNFTAFNILQQEQISEVTDKIHRKLMVMLGIEAMENNPATILVQKPLSDDDFSLPVHYPVMSGSLPFETAYDVSLEPWKVKAMYVGKNGEYRDISRLLETARSAVDVFGHKPTEGTALYCILGGSVHAQSELRFWAQIPDGSRRVPFDADSEDPVFAKTLWQYYTTDGWRDLQAIDNTRGFLTSGEIVLSLDEEPPVLFPETPIYGYAIRCLLQEHSYDTAPRLLTLTGNLFPMVQQKTGAASFVFPGNDVIEIHSSLAALGNIFVYCRDSIGCDYFAYSEASPYYTQKGRFYRLSILQDGIKIEFDRDTYGYGPIEGSDSVLICCYDNELLYHRALGPVYGYEEQIIELDLVSDLVADKISVLAELSGNGDEPPSYRRILPYGNDPDELCYAVLSQEGQLLIHHPAYSGTYELILSDCVTTQGKAGNIRPGAKLSHFGGYDGTEVDQILFAPSPGIGGVSYETSEQLRSRFCTEIRKINTAVTAADYETIAKTTPGLSIHKVKAVIFSNENLVKLVVKPYTEDERPILSPLYIKQLSAHIEKRRMLTTHVELISPRYVRIDVNVKVFTKPHYEHAQEEIENALRKSLDYVTTDIPFGSWIRFSDIFNTLNKLPCVVRVDSLRLIPEDRNDITISSSDFKLSDRALCYPGDIKLEINTFTGNR